jgi:hypothetical protein
MSWWDTGKGDDVIGDAPADLMIGILKEIGEERRRQSKAKASLQELADGFAKALQDAPVDHREAQSPLRMVIKRSRLEDLVGNPQKADEQVTAAVRSGLQKIGSKYQERWNRNPRASELAETLSFALASQPERFLEVPADLEIDQVLVG